MLRNVTGAAREPSIGAPYLEHGVFALAVIAFVLAASGGPGWGAASADAIVGASFDRTAAAPLYGVLGSVAAWLPIGEPGFRLAALDAVLAAAALAGVVAATRALVPKLPAAGAIGALLLALAPPFHDASGPGLLAACGAVWAVAGALRATRSRAAAAAATAPAADARDVLLALTGCAVTIGGEPWLGVALLVAITATLARAGGPRQRSVVALGLAAIGVVTVALWLGAIGRLPGVAPDLGATLAASGRGAGAIVIGAGLLGAAFAAATGLPGARGLLGVIAIAGAHAMLVDVPGDVRGTPLVALLAIGAAIIPVAIVRAAAPAAAGRRALAVTAASGIPLVAVALVAGAPSCEAARLRGDAPARVAHALVDDLPAGPGVVLATREPSSFALAYAHAIAGERPDLGLVPPLPPEQADVVAVAALRAGKIVGGDVPAVGRMAVELARPRGRGFEMLLAAPAAPSDLPREPPRYGREDAGAREAIAEALERARYEASTGRLDQAARAVGLATRFGAADLAVLAATRPGPERPALYDFVPALGTPPGAWQLDLFGDDLAWVAAIGEPDLPPTAPAPRRLHALWRAVLANKLPRDDVRIHALGDEAVRATERMWTAVRPAGAAAGPGSGSAAP
jgi:hypothetical protein